MARLILSIWPLLLAAALILGGNGLQGSALGVRGTYEAFPAVIIGLVFSTYSVGFILGCRFGPRFVAAAGHIRAFAAFASIASAASLAHAVFVNEGLWLVLRVISGFSFATVQMILESWLNETATNESRGRVLSVYRITDLLAVTFAQMSLFLFAPGSFVIFAAISILLSLALVPVALTRVVAPAVPTTARLDIQRLWRVSPAAVGGVIVTGLSGSAIWSMMPVFLEAKGYGTSLVGAVIGAFIFGGALAQWPFGWLSDRVDRRYVQVALALGAGISALLLALFGSVSSAVLISLSLVFGAFALPNFGIAVAHANDHAEQGAALSVNGGLLMLHGLAAIVGPLMASSLISTLGADALYYFIAAAMLALAVFGAYRMTQRAAPEAQAPYVSVPRTSPAVFEMDPRVEELPETPASEAATAVETEAQPQH